MRSSSYAERNAEAARSWAEERRVKLERARRLREERRQGEICDEEYTFVPQKFNNYKSEQAVSEYSQEYLQNFHFDPDRRHERDFPAAPALDSSSPSPRAEEDQNFSLYSLKKIERVGSNDSFGLDHVQKKKDLHQRRINQAGISIVSNPSKSRNSTTSVTLKSQSSFMQEMNNMNASHVTRQIESDLSYEFAAFNQPPRETLERKSSQNQLEEAKDQIVQQSKASSDHSRLSLLKSKLSTPVKKIRVLSSTQPVSSSKQNRVECTRQSGCTCSQCSSDASFKNLLRSDGPVSSRKSKRSPWNSDFSETAPASLSFDKKDPEPPKSGRRFARRNEKKKPRNRPEWQDLIAAGEEDAPLKSHHNVDKMRKDLKGGKRDFFEQMQDQSSKTRETEKPQEISAQYRGIYLPAGEQQADKSGKAMRIDNGGEIPEYAAPQALKTCETCGRKFNEKSYSKHVRVCLNAQKKRETFDSRSVRLQNVLKNPNDAQVIAPSSKKGKATNREKSKKSGNKWKQQSQALREAMKYNRRVANAEAQGKDLSSLPPAPTNAMDSDLVPCPHCNRTFSEKAAERHIPHCKDMKAKPKRLMRGSGRNAVSIRK